MSSKLVKVSGHICMKTEAIKDFRVATDFNLVKAKKAVEDIHRQGSTTVSLSNYAGSDFNPPATVEQQISALRKLGFKVKDFTVKVVDVPSEALNLLQEAAKLEISNGNHERASAILDLLVEHYS